MKDIEDSTLILTIYKEILAGTKNQFPKGVWAFEDSKSHAILLTKYLIEDVLKWNNGDVVDKLSYHIFSKYKLAGMVKTLYGGSSYKAYDNAYPGTLHPWQMVNTPKGYWLNETGISAVKWLVEEKLKLEKHEIPHALTKSVFMNNRLGGLLADLYKSSPRLAVEAAYPGEFCKWRFKFNRRDTWTFESAVQAFTWLIEDELHINPESIVIDLHVRKIRNYGLILPFRKYFNYDKSKLYSALYKEM